MNMLLETATDYPLQPWKYVVLHHSGAERGDVAALELAHRRRRDQFGNPWEGIGYHFVIGNGQGMTDGRIESTYRWREQLAGAHVRSPRHNRLGIGVCLIGDFEQSPPTPRQLSATQKLLESLLTRCDIARRHLLRHADIAATRCPGRLFPLNEVLDRLRIPEPVAAGHRGL